MWEVYGRGRARAGLVYKPGSQHWRLCISRDSDDRVNVGLVSINWGRKRTSEDDIHPGSNHPVSNHPQCHPPW